MRIRPFVLFARWSVGEVTGFPIWFYSRNVRERFPHAAYKEDVFFFLTILRGSLKAIEKLREQGRGEKRKTLLPLPPPPPFLTRRPLPLINS